MATKAFDPKALLEKHGWKFGAGLGKEEGGIKEAIKVELKMDRAGMGYDASEKYSFQWWDHVFNTAANSIEVVSNENGVSIKKTATVDVSTRKQSKKTQMKPKTYGCFVKSATLTNDGIEVKDSDSSDSSSDSDVGVISKMTDEELFKACGGMTGHKGARHGLNLRGKLLRIQQHDEQFLRSQKPLNGSTLNRSSSCSVLENTKMKPEASQGNGTKVETLPLPNDEQEKTKAVSSSSQGNSARKHKKQKMDSEDGTDATKVSADDVDFKPSTTETIAKGKNKKRKKVELDIGDRGITSMEDVGMTCPKLKKKRNRECNDNSIVHNGVSTDKDVVSIDEPEAELKKPEKKTKDRTKSCGDNESFVGEEQLVDQSEQTTRNSEKKSKKLKKKKVQENEEKEQQESPETEYLSKKIPNEPTEIDGDKEQSKKKEKKNRDKLAMTDCMNQPVEDVSMQEKKCKKSKKSGSRKEASMNEIIESTQECNTNESKIENKKCKKDKRKEQCKNDKIVNEIKDLATHELKSPSMKCKTAEKQEAEEVLRTLENADTKMEIKIASKKSKKIGR